MVDRGHQRVQASCGTRLLVSHTRGLPGKLKKLLRRRQVVEPMIGHMKSDGLLDKNWLQGALGDAMHALLSGAGHNLLMILARLRAFYFTLIGWLALAQVLSLPTLLDHHETAAA